jgi:hypothetical protein
MCIATHIAHIWRNSTFDYCVYKSQPLTPILNQTNLFYAVTSSSLRSILILLYLCPSLQTCPFPSAVPHRPCLHFVAKLRIVALCLIVLDKIILRISSLTHLYRTAVYCICCPHAKLLIRGYNWCTEIRERGLHISRAPLRPADYTLYGGV